MAAERPTGALAGVVVEFGANESSDADDPHDHSVAIALAPDRPPSPLHTQRIARP